MVVNGVGSGLVVKRKGQRRGFGRPVRKGCVLKGGSGSGSYKPSLRGMQNCELGIEDYERERRRGRREREETELRKNKRGVFESKQRGDEVGQLSDDVESFGSDDDFEEKQSRRRERGRMMKESGSTIRISSGYRGNASRKMGGRRALPAESMEVADGVRGFGPSITSKMRTRSGQRIVQKIGEPSKRRSPKLSAPRLSVGGSRLAKRPRHSLQYSAFADTTNRGKVISPYPFSKTTSFDEYQNRANGLAPVPLSNFYGKPEIIAIDDDDDEEDRDGSPVSIVQESISSPRKKLRLRRSSKTYRIEAPEDYASKSNDVRLKKVTKEELAKVKSLTTKAGKQDARAEIPAANITLRGEDLARLRGCRWLNDELINSYISLINARNEDYFESKEEKEPNESSDGESSGASKDHSESQTRPKVYVFNTFFFPRLQQNGFPRLQQNGYDYNGVKRWTKRAGIEAGKLDRILIPINLGNYHWLLVMIDLQNREFVYLDSMHAPDTNNILSLVRRWLVDEIKDKSGCEKVKELGIERWKSVVNPSYLPKQRDSGSCGVFTVYVADYLELNKVPDFTQLDMRVLRQRMALYFSEAALPEE
eukprot:Plantae.Rhodophyta-Hildenbrandia_rubra.ctg14608.p1 GENE.Plantae.Rhodophyta-Hildenbrandia_rubra.ctg14608~~Plantae.Rhodophyta-Hildenbrandia_rubra.ctg14608.p1  ORF type:complete len:593 (-),score=108.13 Plantae.Rhodophyta-Hildenbrandia_rubra.ctg14608:89-1867(-)